MITEFLSAYSHFCSKILRIWQKIAVEYCSYKGLTRFKILLFHFPCCVEYCSYKGLTPTLNNTRCNANSVEYCSYKGLTLIVFLFFHFLFSPLNIVLIKD